MRVQVDVGSLIDLAHRVGAVEGRLRAGTASANAALHAAPARTPAAPLLTLTVLARERSMDELAALRVLVALAAECYAATERQVAELVGGCRVETLASLLAKLDPSALEQLLVAVPALVAVVARAGPDQRLADDLTHTLLLPAASAARAQAQLLGLLDPAQRRRFALLHPRLMTAMPGAPTSDRFAASRVLVAADLADLVDARRLLAPGQARSALDRRIAVRQELLDGQVVLRHPDDTATRRPHQLLAFDPAGDGRVVEVLGDLTRAEHLAVFVPGTGSDLARYSGSLGRLVPFAAANPSLAVVLWQNADSPDQPFDDDPVAVPATSRPPGLPSSLLRYSRVHVLAAAFRDAADVAGPALAADVAGLRVAEPRAAEDLTVLGHSYGGSIVGSAEAHGMVADRVVHVASAGAYVDDVRRYTDASTQRFSMTAFDDPIQLSQGHDATDALRLAQAALPAPLDPVAPVVAGGAVLAVGGGRAVGHGLDPDELPGVIRLDTGVHPDGSLVRGHSAMFEPDSTAWRNLLGVMSKGEVAVLQPQLWASHLEPLGAEVALPGGGSAGGTTMRPLPPRYVIDRTPYEDAAYQPPLIDLG